MGEKIVAVFDCLWNFHVVVSRVNGEGQFHTVGKADGERAAWAAVAVRLEMEAVECRDANVANRDVAVHGERNDAFLRCFGESPVKLRHNPFRHKPLDGRALTLDFLQKVCLEVVPVKMRDDAEVEAAQVCGDFADLLFSRRKDEKRVDAPFGPCPSREYPGAGIGQMDDAVMLVPPSFKVLEDKPPRRLRRNGGRGAYAFVFQ